MLGQVNGGQAPRHTRTLHVCMEAHPRRSEQLVAVMPVGCQRLHEYIVCVCVCAHASGCSWAEPLKQGYPS